MPHETTTYRRADLYQQVWAEPVRTVAKRYGVSDVALAKMCRKHGIPLPRRGHWMRIAAGHFDEPTPLPELPEGGAEEWIVKRWMDERTTVPSTSQPKPDVPTISVPAILEDPHDLVKSARSLLSREVLSQDGFLESYAPGCLSIKASPSELDRALRIADAFIKACEERGMRVEVTAVDRPRPEFRYRVFEVPPSAMTRVLVDDEWVVFKLFEHHRVVHEPPPTPRRHDSVAEREWWLVNPDVDYHRIPGGQLELQLAGGSRKVFWRDTRRKRLELRLGEAVVGISTLAAAVKTDRAEAERRKREEEIEARARKAAELRAERMSQRDEAVLESLGRWRLARELREYAADANRIVTEDDSELTPDGDVGQLVDWALSLAKRIDPFEALRNEVAQEVVQRVGIKAGPELETAKEHARAERELITELRGFIANWREAQEIRAHVAACTTVLDGRPLQFEGGETAAEWLSWASQHADRIDPLSGWKHDVARSDPKAGALASATSADEYKAEQHT